MPTFRNGEVEIAYLDEGEGDPIVLVHGFASNKEVNWVRPGWTATLRRDGRRVIALDNRGHGQSAKLYDPALYHTDISRPDAPKVRTLVEEIARIVRGRAANPAWIEGMMRHGYRGAAEVTRSVEGLFAFAATLPARLDRQFDVLFDATLGDERVDSFLCQENPQAREAMATRFDEAIRRDLWRPRRNSVARLREAS